MSLRSSLEDFSRLKEELEARLEDLQTKRELLQEQREDEMARPSSVWMMDSWSAADCISKNEEKIVKNKTTKNEIDFFITSVYETLTCLQLTRVAMILRKLKVLLEKDPQQICPVEYTMKRYDDWVKSDPQINAKQSEILDALTRKVRLTQDSAHQEECCITERGSSIYKFDMKNDFDRFQQTDFVTHGQQFLADERLSDYVRSLLKPSGCNFEAVKLREFINECQKEPSSQIEFAASPQNYQSFICALSEYIFNKHAAVVTTTDSDPTARLDQIYSVVEEAVFPHIKAIIESQLENQNEKDSMLNEQYKKLENIPQKALGIIEKFIDNSIYPHCKAVTEIMKIDVVSTPTEKLKQILIAAYDIIHFMRSLCGEDQIVPGADEFMDIWVYVLLKARIPRFFTTVALLRNYGNPRTRLSETGYYLASFEFAGEYIRTMAEDFTRGKIEVQSSSTSIPDEVFFAPEVSRLGEFLKVYYKGFYVVQENFSLKGFKLIIDYDLQLETTRLYTSFLVEDQGSCVFGSLFSCQQNSKLNSKWVSTQMKKISQDILVKKVQGINIAIRESETSSAPRRYIEVPSGIYDDYRLIFQRNLSLERLGCISHLLDTGKVFEKNYYPIDANKIEELLQGDSCLQLKECHVDQNEHLDDVITERVKNIQTRLRNLHCYSKLLPSSGIYNLTTLRSLMVFQRMYNEQCLEIYHLEVDGICDSRTFESLCRFELDVNS